MTKQHYTNLNFFSSSERWRICWTRVRLESRSLPTQCMQWLGMGRIRRWWRGETMGGWRATTGQTAATVDAAMRAMRVKRPTLKPGRASANNNEASIPSLGPDIHLLRQGEIIIATSLHCSEVVMSLSMLLHQHS